MKLEQIRIIAMSQGIESGRLFKTELIKSIQSKEGNFDCYSTANRRECDQETCCWRNDCFEAALKRTLA